jgi:hypothetical protein
LAMTRLAVTSAEANASPPNDDILAEGVRSSLGPQSSFDLRRPLSHQETCAGRVSVNEIYRADNDPVMHLLCLYRIHVSQWYLHGQTTRRALEG